MQMVARGGQALVRPLHDIDVLVKSFEDIPLTLGSELLMRHVHPHDPAAKTLLQGIDAGTSVRADVFRAYGGEMRRAAEVDGEPLPVVAVEDLAARHARLCRDLVEGKRVAPKYARDFPRLLGAVDNGEVGKVWQEHRKPRFAENFADAAGEIRWAIKRRPELLVSSLFDGCSGGLRALPSGVGICTRSTG
jgi:hypothetical protein